MKRAPWPWMPAGALMGLIFFLSSLTNPPTPLRFPHADKVVHAVLFGGLSAALLLPGLSPSAAALVASLYGAADEFHQGFVPNRDASLGDWLADAAGAATVAAGFWAWRRRRS